LRSPDPTLRVSHPQQGADAAEHAATRNRQVCDRCLHDAASPLEVQLFAAQTLRAKVERDFEELPPGAWGTPREGRTRSSRVPTPRPPLSKPSSRAPRSRCSSFPALCVSVRASGAAASLRDSLVAALLRFAGGPTSVRTVLCLALTALAAHLPGDAWGAGGALPALAARLSAEPPERALPCLLQLLVVFPQEAGSWRPAVRPERRRAYAAELSAATPGALALLAQCAASRTAGGAGVPPATLEAYAGWVRLAQGRDGSGHPLPGPPPPPPGCDAAALAAHPLTLAALDGLAEGESFDAAVEAVSELIRATSAAAPPAAADADEPPPPGLDPRAAPLVALLVPRVMALRPRFAAAAAADDAEDAKGIARLFAEVGETFLELIATGAPDVLAPVEALLEVSAHPDDDVAAVCFNFWSRLARALPAPGAGAAAQPPGDSDAERGRRRALFAPAFAQLVRNVAGRVRHPDGYAMWTRTQRADFKRARAAVGDTCLDAARVLGGEATLGLLSEPLAALAAASAAGTAAFDWRTAEASLYCCRAVARAAPPAQCALLAQLLASLGTLPAVPEVRYTSCLMAAAYADWVAGAVAAGAPAAANLLPSLLGLLTNVLQEGTDAGAAAAAGSAACDARGAASLALRHICDASRVHMAPALPQLLALYARVTAEEAAEDGPLAVRALEAEDVLEVTRAVAFTSAALSDAATLANALSALLSPPLATLAALLPDEPPPGALPPPPPPSSGIVRAFDRLSAIFRDVASGTGGADASASAAAADAVSAAFATRVWPLAERALRRCGEEGACERVCRCIKYALRAGGASRLSGVLPPLGALLRPLFAARRHACLLFAAGELAREFAPHADAAAALAPLLAGLLADACAALPTTRDFNAQPDVADDAFLLADRTLKLLPHVVFAPDTLGALLDAAAAGATVEHREACQSVLTFLCNALRRREPGAMSALSAALPPRGPTLTRALLAGGLVMLPLSRGRDVADALHALLSLAAAAGAGWVRATLALLHESVAPASDVAAFAAVADAVAAGGAGAPSCRALAAALDELAQVCRRNRRAHDGAHAALVAQ
jgi:transportin-3